MNFKASLWLSSIMASLRGLSFSGDMNKLLFHSFGYCPFKGGGTCFDCNIVGNLASGEFWMIMEVFKYFAMQFHDDMVLIRLKYMINTAQYEPKETIL
ncbi:hypothetical protein [Bacteroides stercoris]|uniref:hypothetical protein n=1 Tax=Bacteroides stercoris TaxID=46506 RepID=UPI0013ED9EDB|nr:hypothetical protein [Bacteroides stercoris]